MLYPRPLIQEFKPPTTPQKMLAPLLPFGGGGGDRYHMFMQRVLKALQSLHRGGCEGQHALPPPSASEFKTATHPPKKCCLLGFPLVWCSCSACSCHYNHYTRGDGGGG